VNLRRLEEVTWQELAVLSRNMSHQLDEIVSPMRFITEFLLSDSKSLAAITTLTRTERETLDSPAITLAKRDIRFALSTYCNKVNFYQVTFFSAHGDFLSSNLLVHTIPDGDARPERIPALPLIDAALGDPVLLPPYDDPWDQRLPLRVFSIVRLVMGNNMASYLEVQKPCTVLETLFNLHDDETTRVAVINGRGELFYSQFDDETNALITAQPQRTLAYLTPQQSRKTEALSHPSIGKHIAASFYSPYTDTYTIVMRSRDSMNALVANSTLVTIGLSLLVCLVSVFFIYALSARLTAPMRQLIAKMESTSLETIGRDVVFERTDGEDEFKKLYNTYNELLRRLHHAIKQEKQMSLLHIQAEFDALQAQVNPHFLYNILNVISHRGVLDGDETICEICARLAAMLRYASGTSQRLATIAEELNYVRDYLFLLKTRYRDKLEYTLEAAPEVLCETMPKIVLQQFIENAVTHGCRDNVGQMRIALRGWIEAERWYIEIKDNGSGFDAEKKAALEEKMAALRAEIKTGAWCAGMDIGGMGIPNIYARLLLLGEDVTLCLDNHAGGAVVTLGAKKGVLR
jgi:two-component system sensor histidine kinase YesM